MSQEEGSGGAEAGAGDVGARVLWGAMRWDVAARDTCFMERVRGEDGAVGMAQRCWHRTNDGGGRRAYGCRTAHSEGGASDERQGWSAGNGECAA